MTRRAPQRLDHSVPSPTQGVRPQISDGFLMSPTPNTAAENRAVALRAAEYAPDLSVLRELLDELDLFDKLRAP